MLERYIQSKNTLRPLTDEGNLAKYYDIYDLAIEDLASIESTLASRSLDDQYSLRALRDLFGKLYSARKSVLCCLLALSADGGRSDIARWSSAVEEMRQLAAVTGASMTRMTNILNEEDREFYQLTDQQEQDANAHRRSYSTLTVAHRLSEQREHASAIPATQCAVPRRACFACQDAPYQRGDQCPNRPTRQ